MYETAVKLFALRGFAGTSLQDIADEMGITRPALYYYVESKDDILAKLVTEITETNTAEILDLATDSNLEPVARLSRIAYVMAYNRALHPTRFLLLERSEGELSEGLAKIHEENKRAMLRSVIELIKQGIDSGQFRPVNPRSAALAVIGMCNWVAWWFHEDDKSVAKQVATEIADMAVASLLQSSARNTGLMGPGGGGGPAATGSGVSGPAPQRIRSAAQAATPIVWSVSGRSGDQLRQPFAGHHGSRVRAARDVGREYRRIGDP